jgi:hypothetical protein
MRGLAGDAFVAVTTVRSGSDPLTEERKVQCSTRLVPGWVILIEGISAASVERAVEPALALEMLRSHGAQGKILRGV